MKLDAQQVTRCVESHTAPEPFSGVVCLTKSDEVLFEKGFGLANKAESIPNRVDTRFQIASGSKIFTSVAVCQLVEAGKLGFDTPLKECVDVAFPDHATNITIHHLLTHSSGITSYFDEAVNSDYEALWESQPMYKMDGPRAYIPLLQGKPMKFPPGERFDYNDGGYILLGLVIECMTGREFPALIRDMVLEPAGMKDSGCFSTDQLPERTACSYIRTGDTWRTNIFAVPIVGASDGGAYATAADMAAFWKALMGNKLLSPGTTRLLLDTQIGTSLKAPHGHYGYGVWVERSGAAVRKRFVEGSDPGVAMRSAIYPDEGIVLTIIGNTGSALWPVYKEVERILDL